MLLDEAGPLLDEASEKIEDMKSSVKHVFAIRVSIVEIQEINNESCIVCQLYLHNK